MLFEEFKTQLENVWKNHFPKSKINIYFTSNLGNAIFIDTYLVENREELSGGYFENDMIKNSFMLYDLKDKNNLETFEVSSADCGFMIKPELEWLYCSYKNIRFTKKKQENCDGFIKKFTKYVETLKSEIINCYNNNLIHDDYKKLVEEKIINCEVLKYEKI